MRKLLVVFLFLFAGAAVAQEGHMRWHHWYKTWTVPGTNTSCCSAREYMGEHPYYGDCEPSKFTLRRSKKDGGAAWFAQLPKAYRDRGDENGEVEIPQEKILREKNPSYEEGHLCWTPYSGVICALPPNTDG